VHFSVIDVIEVSVSFLIVIAGSQIVAASEEEELKSTRGGP